MSDIHQMAESLFALTAALKVYAEAVNGNRAPAATALKKAIVQAHAAGAIDGDEVESFMSLDGLAGA